MPLKTLPVIGYNFLEQQFIILNKHNILEHDPLKKKKQNKMN